MSLQTQVDVPDFVRGASAVRVLQRGSVTMDLLFGATILPSLQATVRIFTASLPNLNPSSFRRSSRSFGSWLLAYGIELSRIQIQSMPVLSRDTALVQAASTGCLTCSWRCRLHHWPTLLPWRRSFLGTTPNHFEPCCALKPRTSSK